jgi:hypothetical protein
MAARRRRQYDLSDPFERKLQACKDLMSKADDLAMDIVSLMGGDAEIEGSPERMAIFQYVWQLPRFDHPARDRIMRETL